MNARDALIVALPDQDGAPPLWLRVVENVVVETGAGPTWLAACGLPHVPKDTTVMLVPPVGLVTLHWITHPDLPVRQGRAAARLAAMTGAIVPADSLFAVANDNADPAWPHIVAVAARADMQHWLLWAQHHGLDPDLIVPAPLLLPEPEAGFSRASVGGSTVLRGTNMALAGDIALPVLVGDAPVRDVPAAAVNAVVLAALDNPPINLRQGDFARRVARSWDKPALTRIMMWSCLILSIGLMITLVGIARQTIAAARLDAQSLAMARQVLPNATDIGLAEADMDRQLAARGVGGYAFTAPLASVLSAIRDTPGVSLIALSRDSDGMVRATLAAAKAADINMVLLALQAAGFTITATPSRDPGGRTLADITVRS